MDNKWEFIQPAHGHPVRSRPGLSESLPLRLARSRYEVLRLVPEPLIDRTCEVPGAAPPESKLERVRRFLDHTGSAARGDTRITALLAAIPEPTLSCRSPTSLLTVNRVTLHSSDAENSRIAIEYCTQCRWLLRAAWMAQELLTTFSTEIGELALMPGAGGVFEIRIDHDLVWSQAEKGRFPEIKELKQLVRDRIGPGRDLGHSDR